MEKLQGPIIHPCLLEEHLEVGCIDQQNGGGLGISTCGQFMSRFEVVDPHYSSLPTLEDKMPFLQMLQGIEPPQPFLPPPPFLQEPNFQLLLRLQQEKINMNMNMNMSCFTNNNNDMMLMEDQLRHSPVKSEITTTQQQVTTPPPLSQSFSQRRKAGGRSNIRAAAHLPKACPDGGGGGEGGGGAHRERRKRKRAARPRKNKEQVESQRMTHIAVERNRRRQMNEHLNALRSLMPPSYVQRGDQASIIGGAIDFVKELEQLLHSLQAQKRVRQQCEDQNGDVSATSTTSTTTCSSSNFFRNVSSLHFRNNSQLDEVEPGGFAEYAKANHEQELCAENRSSLADIEVVVIQNHVNLKVQCQRRPGQLLKAIVALEDIRLSVLHLNITSLHSLVLYSFNLKIEDDCKLGSANEVASAVHQIFSLINIT